MWFQAVDAVLYITAFQRGKKVGVASVDLTPAYDTVCSAEN